MTQKPIFSSFEEYKTNLNKMYENIKEKINDWVVKDKSEYIYMSSLGLTPNQEMYIVCFLIDELKFLTRRPDDWCDNVSGQITAAVSSFLDGLVKIKRTDFTAQEYAELINNSIQMQLDHLLDNEEGLFPEKD